MKQINKRESNWGFQKKCKNRSTEQEIVSDATFKAWSFSSDFNFVCKDDRVNTATCKYYCPFIVNPTINNCWKELHLKYGRVFRSVFENAAIHENYSGLVISKCCHLY